MTNHSEDPRLTAARNFLATAPASDFTRLLAGVVGVADDYAATELDLDVTQVTHDGAVYIAASDVHRLPPDLVESLQP